MTIYLTYERYTELGGNLIPQDEFNKVARVISRKIDGLTFNRIVKIGYENLTPYQRGLIEEATLEMCDFEYDNADLLNSNIASYTLNGVSIGFGNNQGSITSNGVTVSQNGYQILKQTGLTTLRMI